MSSNYEIGTKLKDARNKQIYPITKVECVEGLEGYLGDAVITPDDDTLTNSVPVTTDDGSVDWIELQAGNIPVKISSTVFTEGSLEEVLRTISEEITKLQEAISAGGGGGSPSDGAGFIPVSVMELPVVGTVGVVYRVPINDPKDDQNRYEEYYWTGDHYEKIGEEQGEGTASEWLE